MLELADKDFKVTFINMFKDLKEKMITMNLKIETLGWEMEFFSRTEESDSRTGKYIQLK